jgi:hypothetical protein
MLALSTLPPAGTLPVDIMDLAAAQASQPWQALYITDSNSGKKVLVDNSSSFSIIPFSSPHPPSILSSLGSWLSPHPLLAFCTGISGGRQWDLQLAVPVSTGAVTYSVDGFSAPLQSAGWPRAAQLILCGNVAAGSCPLPYLLLAFCTGISNGERFDLSLAVQSC